MTYPATYPATYGSGASFLSYDATLSRVVIAVASTGYSGTGVAVVQRSLDQIQWATVRGCQSVPISSSAPAVYDYEFTPGVVNYYRVQAAVNANSGFETNVSDWTASDSGTFTQSGLWAHDGSYSGLLHGDGSTANPKVTCEQEAVSVGDQLTFTPWLYSPQGWGDVQTAIGWYTSGGTLISQATADTALLEGVAAQAIPLSVTIPSGVSAAKAAAWVEIVGTPGSSVQVLIDDAALTGGSAQTYTDNITPVLTSPWLKNIRYPFLNLAVDLSDASDITRPSNSSTFVVIGRQNQVAVTLPRGGRQFTLTIATTTDEETEAVHAALNTGDVVLLQVPADYIVPLTGYYSAGDTVETRQAVVWTNRWISVPLTETDPPGPDITGSTITWQGVVNDYATWTDLATAQATWADVLTLIGQAGDVLIP